MVNKAAWALAVLIPAGAAAVWFSTRGDDVPASQAPANSAAAPQSAAAQPAAPQPAEPKAKPAPYDPGKPTPEISAERKTIEAIGKSKDYSPANEARLVQALSHIDQDVRGHAAWGLGELAPKTRGAIDGLIGVLGDEIWAVQHNAAWALAQFERADVEQKLVGALSDASPTRRIRASKALMDLNAEEFTPKVESILLAAYDRTTSQPRTVALQAMGQLRPPSESTIALLSSAISSDDDALVSNAVNALSGLGPAAQSAVPVLVTAYKHKKQEVRRGVASALANIGSKVPLVFETLIAMLDDTKDGPADEAAQALARLEAWDVLDQAFSTKGPRTRKFVVSAWRQGKTDETRRIGRMIAALDDVDPGVRLAAAGGFLDRDVPDAVPALAKAMRDPDSAVAGHAKTALERMKNPAAKAALNRKGP